MLAGLTASLTPDFNFLEVATPHAKKLIGQATGGAEGLLGLLGASSLEELAQTSLREGIALVRSLTRLPRELDRVLTKAEKGELRIIIEPQIRAETQHRGGSNRALDTLRRPVPLWASIGIAGALASAWGVVEFLRRRGRLGA